VLDSLFTIYDLRIFDNSRLSKNVRKDPEKNHAGPDSDQNASGFHSHTKGYGTCGYLDERDIKTPGNSGIKDRRRHQRRQNRRGNVAKTPFKKGR
jgi:hypothetical protein